MKNYHFLIACTGVQVLLLSFLFSNPSQASYIINFDDTVNYWTGYGNGTSQDNKDVIGTPNITGGSAVMNDNGFLDSVSFIHTRNQGSSPDIGDLFLDVGSDGYWDYVIDVETVGGWGNSSDMSGVIYSFTDSAFHISQVNYYVLSDSYWNGGHRKAHPTGYDSNAGIGTNTGLTASVKGPFILLKPVTFTFSDNLIDISGQSLTIAFGASCANDVILSTINIPEAVPEPATMFLFGIGLAGLVGTRRLKKK